MVEGGVALRPDRSGLAGSVATADRLVRTMARASGLPDAVRMMTATPARILGLTAKGRLAPGCDADIVLFDDDVNVSRVFIGGKEIF